MIWGFGFENVEGLWRMHRGVGNRFTGVQVPRGIVDSENPAWP